MEVIIAALSGRIKPNLTLTSALEV